jgi:AraC-like DNA-binding protein
VKVKATSVRSEPASASRNSPVATRRPFAATLRSFLATAQGGLDVGHRTHARRGTGQLPVDEHVIRERLVIAQEREVLVDLGDRAGDGGGDGDRLHVLTGETFQPPEGFTWRVRLSSVTPEELADLAHLRRARDLMDREYARPLDVATLARAALMSSAHFSRRFRAAYGETPYGYLMTRRIERAKTLLRGSGLSVTEVCLEVGCTSLGSFSARFTQLVGETPTAYRAGDHRALAAMPDCVAKDIGRPSRIGEAPAVAAP